MANSLRKRQRDRMWLLDVPQQALLLTSRIEGLTKCSSTQTEVVCDELPLKTWLEMMAYSCTSMSPFRTNPQVNNAGYLAIPQCETCAQPKRQQSHTRTTASYPMPGQPAAETPWSASQTKPETILWVFECGLQSAREPARQEELPIPWSYTA